jgi:hypothetical protein
MKNPPAFPTNQYANGISPSGFDKGMTLRDYFAGQALAGNLEQGLEDDMNIKWWHPSEKIAKRAYAIADAMLKAREA